jgi:DNA repair photolyase
MNIREIWSKSILSNSKIYPYTINPYVGCQHGCTYCYARYMKKFTGHTEPWGMFVDVKVNAPQLLRREILKKEKAEVWISGVCDPYQPLEKKYELTRQCLQILISADWPVAIQTRSPLVVRDIDILKEAKQIQVCFSIPTGNDGIRKLFEPHAPSIPDRVSALAELRNQGIRTGAMIAPMLPGAEKLPGLLAEAVDYVLVDRMNYHHADSLYRKHGLQETLSTDYFNNTSEQIAADCRQLGLDCRIVF